MKNTMTLILCTILVSGCCGGSKKNKKFLCEASIEGTKGNHFSIGTNTAEDQARESAIWGACFVFCNWEDADVDAAYQEWAKTEEGLKSQAGRVADLDLQVELEALRDSCISKCEASVASGLVPIKVQCHPPQSGTCETKLTYNDKIAAGSAEGADSEYHSRRKACRSYCIDNDKNLDKLYEAWKLTDKGKNSPWKEKDKALDKDSVLSDYLNTCQGDCLGDVMRGMATANTTCN